MVVLGGLGSVTGPLVGAVVLLGLEEVLKSRTEYWALIQGGIIFAVVLMLPSGLRQIAELALRPGAGSRRAGSQAGD